MIDGMLASRNSMSLARDYSKILVAELEGKIIGFSVLQAIPYCGPLFVVPKHRGSGLADNLARQTIDFLVKNGARGWIVVATSPHVPRLCEANGMHKLPYPVYTTEVLNVP